MRNVIYCQMSYTGRRGDGCGLHAIKTHWRKGSATLRDLSEASVFVRQRQGGHLGRFHLRVTVGEGTRLARLEHRTHAGHVRQEVLQLPRHRCRIRGAGWARGEEFAGATLVGYI